MSTRGHALSTGATPRTRWDGACGLCCPDRRLSKLSHAYTVSRTWYLHQKTTSGQRGPASTAAGDTRRTTAFAPFCPCPASHPLGRLVTLSASSRLDRLATEPSGHRGRSTHFATSEHAFITSLACTASPLASEMATTVHTQCATTYCSTHRDDHLWTLTHVCSHAGFANRLSRLRTLDKVHPRPGFSCREGSSAHFRPPVSDGSRVLPDQIALLYSFPFFHPLFPSSRRQVKETSFSFLCSFVCISLRIPWA